MVVLLDQSMKAGGTDEQLVQKCRRPPAGGDGNAPLFPLMFPEVRTPRGPRQEEHHSTPAEVKTSTFQRGRLTRWPPGAWGSHERRLPFREPADRPTKPGILAGSAMQSNLRRDNGGALLSLCVHLRNLRIRSL